MREGCLFYALDNSFLILHGNPIRHRNRGPFFDDGDDACYILCNLITTYIIYALKNDLNSFLILPGHQREFNTNFNTVGKRADNLGSIGNRHWVQITAINAAYKVFKSDQNRNLEDFVSFLKEYAYAILPLISDVDNNDLSEFRRYLMLAKHMKLFSIDDLLDSEIIGLRDKSFHQNANPLIEASDYLWTNEGAKKRQLLEEKWYDLLRRIRRIEGLPLAMDAEAMATLETINLFFKQRSYNARLILITTEKNVFNWSWSSDNQDSKFIENYLYHPLSFFSEMVQYTLPEKYSNGKPDPCKKNIEHNPNAECNERFECSFNPIVGDNSELNDWLTTFLGTINKQNRLKYIKKLKEIATGISMSTNDVTLIEQPDYLDLKSKWNKYLSILGMRDLALQLYCKNQYNNNFRLNGVEKIFHFLETEELQKIVEHELKSDWECLYEAGVAAGGWFVFKNARHPARSAPILRFDRSTEAKNFVKIVLTTYPKYLQLKEFRGYLNSIDKYDKCNYLFYLSMGVLFAARGGWIQALILSSRAHSSCDSLKVLENEPIPNKMLSGEINLLYGDEAAFLRAVSNRLVSTKMEHFTPSLFFLNDAYKRRKIFLRHKLKEPHKELTFEIRYECEKVAIFLSTYLLYKYEAAEDNRLPNWIGQLFRDGPIDMANLPTDENGRIADLPACLGRLRQLLPKTEEETDPFFRQKLKRMILINMFSTIFLGKKFINEPWPNTIYLKKIFNNFKFNMENGESKYKKSRELPKSFRCEIYYFFARWLVADEDDRINIVKQASDKYNPDEIKKGCILKYDNKRYNDIISMISTERYLNAVQRDRNDPGDGWGFVDLSIE